MPAKILSELTMPNNPNSAPCVQIVAARVCLIVCALRVAITTIMH